METKTEPSSQSEDVVDLDAEYQLEITRWRVACSAVQARNGRLLEELKQLHEAIAKMRTENISLRLERDALQQKLNPEEPA